MSGLRETLSQTWLSIQISLFPWLSEELGPLTKKQQELVAILELIRIEEFIYSSPGFPGRPPKDRIEDFNRLIKSQNPILIVSIKETKNL